MQLPKRCVREARGRSSCPTGLHPGLASPRTRGIAHQPLVRSDGPAPPRVPIDGQGRAHARTATRGVARFCSRRPRHRRELRMTYDDVETYLAMLSDALRKRGVSNLRMVEESRGHLADAVDEGIQRGLESAHSRVAEVIRPVRLRGICRCDLCGRKRTECCRSSGVADGGDGGHRNRLH